PPCPRRVCGALPGGVAWRHGRIDRSRDEAVVDRDRDARRDERANGRDAVAVDRQGDHVHGPDPVHPGSREHPQCATASEGSAQARVRGGIVVTPQVLAIIMAVVLLFAVIMMLRSYVLPEKYAVIWIIASVAA